MKNTAIILIMLLIVSSACKRTTDGNTGTKKSTTDSTYGLKVADTIIYEVVIKNTNADDIWANECLKGLDRKLLIDKIFALIYSGDFKAYDHVTNEELTIKKVKEIEKEPGFNRDLIRMIQFNEAWFIDSVNMKITKEVNSMVLGSGRYTNNGEFVGNKALFRVELR